MEQIKKAKTCTKCGIEKGLDQFGNNKKYKDKLNYYCKSCHNDNCEKYREENKNNPEWVKTRIYGHKKSICHRRGKLFTLKFEDIIWPEKCPFLNIELDYKYNTGMGGNSPSFDQIIHGAGYTPENTRIVSNLYNTARGTRSDAETKKWLKKVKYIGEIGDE